MVFLIPAGILAAKVATALTVAQVATGLAAAGGAALTGAALYNSGRRKGQAEGRASCAADIQAMRDRLDEMENEL